MFYPVLVVKVRIALTHNRGQLAATGNRGREPLEGQLASHLLKSPRGTHQVVRLCTTEVMAEPLAELHDASLYCIGVTGFHLRGYERVTTPEGPAWVLQGWLVNPL